MNEAKHTPAPWRISDENPKIIKQDFSMIGSNHGAIVACACGYDNTVLYPSEERAIANARLIAAAPENLQSNSELATIVRELCAAYGHPLPEAALARSDAAIAKATGRADSGEDAQGDRHE